VVEAVAEFLELRPRGVILFLYLGDFLMVADLELVLRRDIQAVRGLLKKQGSLTTAGGPTLLQPVS